MIMSICCVRSYEMLSRNEGECSHVGGRTKVAAHGGLRAPIDTESGGKDRYPQNDSLQGAVCRRVVEGGWMTLTDRRGSTEGMEPRVVETARTSSTLTE